MPGVPGIRPAATASAERLLVSVARQVGDVALANVAPDGALAGNPRSAMAKLLRQVVNSAPPRGGR